MSAHDPQTANPARSVKVFRSFTLLSFLAIAVAGFVLAWCFRYISIESITRQSEASNLVVAQASRHASHEDIAAFLLRLEKSPGEDFPPAIAANFLDLVKDTAVRKVKIYNRLGDVVFSTQATEIGRHQADNDGVRTALAGKVASELVYRDSFNRLDGVTEEDNMVQTYLPIQVEHTGNAVGVFEIYTDVASTVALSVNAQIIITLASILVMVLLYISLLATVRRIRRVIVVQQDALQSRSDLLAALSARMLDAQESEKQRIAAELHERVAQTISAVKLGVEGAILNLRNGSDPSPILSAMVPALQAATQDVRLIAVGLCPPSLRELGLIPTLRWRCREFAEQHPNIHLDAELDTSEEGIPEALRAIVYRVLDDALNALAEKEVVDRVMLRLDSDPDRVVLLIGDDARDELAASDARQLSYLSARERTMLSGGKFSLRHNAWGGITMQAVWLM